MNLRNKSFLNIEENFGYVKTTTLQPAKRYILHMYPTHDTLDQHGNLNGYDDALFFDCKIFNPEDKSVYMIENRDGVTLSDDIYVMNKVYKDGSFMMDVSSKQKGRKLSIGIFQALDVRYEFE